MSLQLRKSSNWWYAQFVVDGKRRTFNLDVPVRGKRPRSINRRGDADFEESRIEAQAAHDRKRRKMQADRHGIQAAQTVVRLRTGLDVEFPRVEDLVSLWKAIPRKRPPSDRYMDQCQRVLDRFVEFIQEEHADITRLIDIGEPIAQEFMATEEARGISGKQYNETLKLLRSAYKRLHQSLGIMTNPFYTVPYKEVETMHRRPFTPEELARIYEAVQDDDFMRPVVVCGMCTAMRLGDCATLRWDDVDLDEDFIRVKTQKTGETVEIPIFALLRKELVLLKKAGEFVFPDQAAMYRRNQSGLSYRFKKILIKAGFGRSEDDDSKEAEKAALEVVPDDELHSRAYAYIDEMERPINKPEKPDRMRQVFDLYAEGKTIPQISEETGFSRGSVSGYLNELEDELHVSIIHRKPTGVRKAKGEMSATRKNGKRRASRMDFHSFRASWISLALTRGIPMDLVRVVTGHRTVEIVFKHYFKPRREELRAALQKHMPTLLTGPQTKGTEPLDLKQLLASADEENAWQTLQKIKNMVRN